MGMGQRHILEFISCRQWVHKFSYTEESYILYHRFFYWEIYLGSHDGYGPREHMRIYLDNEYMYFHTYIIHITIFFYLEKTILHRACTFIPLEKMGGFLTKKYWYFLISPLKQMLLYSLEVHHWGLSNEFQQHMFLRRNKKNIYLIRTLI